MRSVVSTVLVSLALSLGASTAPAFHFELVKSSPVAGAKLESPPARLQLWFSQAPAAGVSALSLKRGDADVELGKMVIVAGEKSFYADPVKPLAAGDYLIKWRGAGDDGHVSTGDVKFTVVAK